MKKFLTAFLSNSIYFYSRAVVFLIAAPLTSLIYCSKNAQSILLYHHYLEQMLDCLSLYGKLFYSLLRNAHLNHYNRANAFCDFVYNFEPKLYFLMNMISLVCFNLAWSLPVSLFASVVYYAFFYWLIENEEIFSFENTFHARIQVFDVKSAPCRRPDQFYLHVVSSWFFSSMRAAHPVRFYFYILHTGCAA